MQAERLLPKRSNGFYHTTLHVKKENKQKLVFIFLSSEFVYITFLITTCDISCSQSNVESISTLIDVIISFVFDG